MAALVQQLDTYSKIGIPKLHHQAHFEYEDEVEEGEYFCFFLGLIVDCENSNTGLVCHITLFSRPSALYSLEEDWTDLVKNAINLGERVRSQQTAIWELVETEVAYIRTLKVIQDVSCTFRSTTRSPQLACTSTELSRYCIYPRES